MVPFPTPVYMLIKREPSCHLGLLSSTLFLMRGGVNLFQKVEVYLLIASSFDLSEAKLYYYNLLLLSSVYHIIPD